MTLGDPPERSMSHQPQKETKKKAQHTPKEKKSMKQQKKQAGDTAPFLKH
jgi:hypothetical protein